MHPSDRLLMLLPWPSTTFNRQFFRNQTAGGIKKKKGEESKIREAACCREGYFFLFLCFFFVYSRSTWPVRPAKVGHCYSYYNDHFDRALGFLFVMIPVRPMQLPWSRLRLYTVYTTSLFRLFYFQNNKTPSGTQIITKSAPADIFPLSLSLSLFPLYY